MNKEYLINYSLDKYFRGIGLGKLIIEQSISKVGNGTFIAQVKSNNFASLRTFQKLEFKKVKNKNDSFTYIKVRKSDF